MCIKYFILNRSFLEKSEVNFIIKLPLRQKVKWSHVKLHFNAAVKLSKSIQQNKFEASMMMLIYQNICRFWHTQNDSIRHEVFTLTCVDIKVVTHLRSLKGDICFIYWHCWSCNIHEAVLIFKKPLIHTWSH